MTALNDLWVSFLSRDWAGFLAGQPVVGSFYTDYNAAITATHTADNSVTNASETILASNNNRKGMIIQNVDSADNARVTLDGSAATTTNGLQLKPGQALTFFKPFCPKGDIKAIREGAADTTIHVVEFT